MKNSINTFLGLFFFIALFSTGSLYANKLIVCKGCVDQNIQKAINKSNPFDTIIIKSGIYQENNIKIDKPLTIMGENYPEIDGNFTNSVFVIKASQVTVNGLLIKNCGKGSLEDYAGLKVISGKKILISNNKLIDNFFAIYLSGVSGAEVRKNTIIGSPTTEQNSGNGIHLWQCDNVLIKNNKSTGHRDGIYFEFVTNSTVEGNISEKNIRYGLHFMFSHNNAYHNNVFKKNGAGVAVMYTRGVKMTGNTFEDNWGGSAYGLLLKDITDSEIYNNRFVQNTIALHMEGSNRINVCHNTFIKSGWALRIQASCEDNRFEKNNFIGNTFDVGTNGSLQLNNFDGNYWDKYEGYDLNNDQIGDIPFRPLSMYSMIVDQIPYALAFYRSFMSTLLDRIEKVIPSLIPENLIDNNPSMKMVPKI